KAVSSAIERIAKRMNLLGCEPWMSDLGSLLRAHESINNAHFVMALEILNTIELSILEADSLAPIFKCLYAQLRGAVEANLQAPATAMKWLDEASVRGNALGSGHRLLASITNAQSLVLLQMGDFRGAKQKCLELAESGVLQMPSKPWFENDLNLVIANQGIAVSDGDLNALNAAATRLEELVDGAISEQIPICRVTQGMNRFLAGDYEKATEHMHEALDLVSENDSHSSTQRLAECLVNVGWVDLLEGNLRDAERRFTMAIDQFIVVLGPQHPRVAEARGYRARALLELGNTDEARNEIMLALESRELLLHDVLGSSLSQRDCLAYVANLRNHWEAPHWPGVFDAYLELGPRLDIDPVDQYRHLLKWKASEARYAIPQGSSAAGPKEHALLDKLAEVRKGMRPLRWQVRDLRQTEEQRHTAVQRLDVLEQEAARLERQLRGIAPTRFGRLASSDAVTTDTICKALQDGEVLVDFLIIGVAKKIEPGSDIRPEKRLIAFILDSHGKIERVDLGELRTIELAATEFVRVCRTPPSESVSSSSSTALTDLIYRPLEPHLMDASTIFIVPDGPLYAVPFAAIPSGEADKSWIDQATLVYLPRAQALVSDRRANTSTSSPSLLLVSDVDYGALSLSPLPNSGVEADEVKAYFHQYFPNGPVDDFRALDATKPEVCRSMSAHRFVHLATHGAYLPETPTQGGGSRMAAFDWATQLDTSIVLSPGRPSDGGLLDNAILTAAEFSALDLSGVELAVLSACETGRGRVISGHGISGMPLALEQAGAANAVVSLWKVHDAGTRQLMSNFYEHLWSNEGSPGPADSLRGAQLNMQDNREHTDFSHPYYWAGFVAYQLR
ncbi:MAG: CHAT domain-containing tetratricopeptide repeat protein, partial [Pirellulales bacterium]